MGNTGRQDPKEGGHTSKKGYNVSQDCQEGGHTIQEEVHCESRPLRRQTPSNKGSTGSQSWGTLGVKTLEKVDTPSKKEYKGSQEGVQWE